MAIEQHSTQTNGSSPRSEITFPVTGMTCASCVRRIEKRLSKLECVSEASVNLATEKSTVVFDPGRVDLSGMTAAVEAAGYGVREQRVESPEQLGPEPGPLAPTIPRSLAPDPDADRQRETNDLRNKFSVGLAIGALMMAAMYAPLRLPVDQQTLHVLMLLLATPVQLWAGSGFYRATWAAAKHGETNMNTLVAVGTSVAYGYSAFVTLFPTVAGRLRLPIEVYFETAVIIIALILMGRWLEARAKGQTSAAIKALMGFRRGPPVSCGTGRKLICRSRRCGSATWFGSGLARRCRSTVCCARAPQRSTRAC